MTGLELLWSLVQASTLSLGAQTALPLLRQQLVVPGILTDRQMIEALAIGRLGTGPGGLYIVSLGYFALGWAGAAIALVAVVFPPLVVVPAATALRRQLLSVPFAGLLRGVTLCTCGLVIPTTLDLAVGSSSDSIATWWQALLVVAGIAIGIEGKRHPALVIGLGAAIGIALARG